MAVTKSRIEKIDYSRRASVERLRAVLIDAVNRRGTREFKYYCRLAVPLATPGLVKQLQLASVGIDRARASRARPQLMATLTVHPFPSEYDETIC